MHYKLVIEHFQSFSNQIKWHLENVGSFIGSGKVLEEYLSECETLIRNFYGIPTGVLTDLRIKLAKANEAGTKSNDFEKHIDQMTKDVEKEKNQSEKDYFKN